MSAPGLFAARVGNLALADVLKRFVPRWGGFVVLWLLLAVPASAHTASTAWLVLEVNGAQVQGTWEVAIRDVDLALTLDADGDGRVTWGEVRRKQPAIETWAATGLDLRADGVRLALQIRSVSISEVTGVPCLQLECHAVAAAAIRELSLTYGLLFDLDRMHRGLVRIVDPSHPAGTSAVLGPDDRSVQVESGSPRSSPP